MPYPTIDLCQVNTYPIKDRHNLVRLKDLIHPSNVSLNVESGDGDLIGRIVDLIAAARQGQREVIWMMGGHVIKSGLSPLVIDLMQKGFITHLAGNGAVSIHDLELAMIGETSEDVASGIEKGTFGMAEETGRELHKALRLGARNGLGYGEALGRHISENKFTHREISIMYQAYELKIPMTIHTTIGADIVHQHPDCDFGILGWSSGHDFKVFCHSVSKLENGVFLNFGSAVTGPEVFLKAVSITRNLGFPVTDFTTANFDLIPLSGDTHRTLSKENPEYFYRPRKNVINRPVSNGGEGYHIQGDHKVTIPAIHQGLMKKTDSARELSALEIGSSQASNQDVFDSVRERSEQAHDAVMDFVNRHPRLENVSVDLCQVYLLISQCFEWGGTLFLAGNGGSMADALHISGELLKSYRCPRQLAIHKRKHLEDIKGGELAANHLQEGFRVMVLGNNPALSSAVENDFQERRLGLAQQLNAMARPGDVILGISTSGKAINIFQAFLVARASGMQSVLLTGELDSKLSGLADLTIQAPYRETDRIQEAHTLIYHCLCEMLELDFFGDRC